MRAVTFLALGLAGLALALTACSAGENAGEETGGAREPTPGTAPAAGGSAAYGAPEPAPGPTTYRDEAARFTVVYPDGWQLAPEPLTPALADPRELFSLGTYPLRAGGNRCPQVPEQALEDLGPDDALVSVQERSSSAPPPAEAFAPRPARFGPALGWGYEELEFTECLERRTRFFLRWIPFQDAGRAFYALVAIGYDATAETQAEVWRILDSFQPSPAG